MKKEEIHNIRAEAVLKSMTESVLITSPDLESPGPYILYVNPAFERMTGWSREEILGLTPRILQGVKTDKSIFNDLKEKLENGDVWEGQTVNYKKDGKEFIMEWSITPMRDKNGKIFQHLAVQRDVTHRVMIERKLDESMASEKIRLEELHKVNRRLKTLNQEQEKTLNLFVKYVPEPIVSKAIYEESHSIFEGEQLNVSLLFCDIRGFTAISEKLDPNEVVTLLNIYYSNMAQVIKRYFGNISQFVGDEIFVTFGAPFPVDHSEEKSVLCAIDMISALRKINKTLRKTLNAEIHIGIGINHGLVVAGNLGSDDRLSYSITGDAVNTAKRIEALTKGRLDLILISQSVYKKSKHLINTDPWEPVEIRGKNEKIKVYEVFGLKNKEE
ncbi:adenylate/guanylate cyclase domain-containing protein [Bacteroidota bacterium]